MSPTGNDSRILQIHPTRRCNLSCAHCYSTSGPKESGELNAALLVRSLKDAWDLGYNIAGFSGGEPTLYPALRDVLTEARQLGMRTTVTSNGLLLDPRRLEILQGLVDVLAISVDGVPESHDRIRGPGAFSLLERRLAEVRNAGIPFGIIFTLTQYNVHELSWVADFAQAQGATLFQVHPLEEVGRAGQELRGAHPDGLEMTWGWLEALQARIRTGIQVQVDLLDTTLATQQPERLFADGNRRKPDTRLSDLMSPLIIETDGTVVPMQYGFGRELALGSIYEAPLRELADRWIESSYPHFVALCEQVYQQLQEPREYPFVNWFGMLSEQSRQFRRDTTTSALYGPAAA